MFKARMKFAKEGRAKYISHLDLMHAMQRSMARCQMPLWFTEGFNQHAYVSVGLPLSTGYSGECEFLDFNITAEAVPENAVEALNDVFPASHGVLRMVRPRALPTMCAICSAAPWSRSSSAPSAAKRRSICVS